MTDGPLDRHTAAACFKQHIDDAVDRGGIGPKRAGNLKEKLDGIVAELDDAYDVDERDADNSLAELPDAVDIAVALSAHVNEAAYVGAIDDATKRGLHSDLDYVVEPVLANRPD